MNGSLQIFVAYPRGIFVAYIWPYNERPKSVMFTVKTWAAAASYSSPKQIMCFTCAKRDNWFLTVV
jgi:hypothetical protein